MIKNKYSWVKTHLEIVDYLKNKEDSQLSLINLLKSINITGFNDKDVNGDSVELEVIDPFTFFSYLHKYGDKKRLKNLQQLATKLNLFIPDSVAGIPTSNAQKVWLFPYKKDRKDDEIKKLWSLFYELINDSISEKNFKDVLNISNVGPAKLTEGLFNISPSKYFPINGPTRAYLRNHLNINSEFNSYQEYQVLLKRIKATTSMPFYELSYMAWENRHLKKQLEYTSVNTQKKQTSLNQILYGPPGTGKTYCTRKIAVNIVNPEFSNSEGLKAEYDRLVAEGKIVFTTFHQSMSYEDFIEGIKPIMIENSEEFSSSNIGYDIKNGIFKEIVENIEDEEQYIKEARKSLYIPEEKFRHPVNKVSLGNTMLTEDKVIYEYCMDNDCIAIGFGEDIDFTGVISRSDIRRKYKEADIDIKDAMDFNISAIERLVIWMKPGQLVFVSSGTRTLKAIGEVTGEYYCDSKSPIRYSQFRKVKWLYKDLDLPITDIYHKRFSHQSIYQMDPYQIKKEFFTDKYRKKDGAVSNHVLIIDEINRGNVSAIFGELITLLEKDKRLGGENSLTVKLPYSKTEFGVPSNLYIIGTMNTADRSVEALDTALRRRFSFKEMMPKSELLEGILFNEFNLKQVLETINNRIEVLLDRDHTIGHSYLMNIASNDTEALKDVFKDKVIPLLQEYFYHDYEKIALVLGEGFVDVKQNQTVRFAAINGADSPEPITQFTLKTEIEDIESAIKQMLE